jgi:hypothetical protein
MAYVHWKSFVKQKRFDPVGMLVGSGNFPKFLKQDLTARRLFRSGRFDADDRYLVAPGSDAHQCASGHVGVLIEDGLTGDGKEYPVRGDDPVVFSTAEPDTSLFVTPAQVPHAVPEAIPLADL